MWTILKASGAQSGCCVRDVPSWSCVLVFKTVERLFTRSVFLPCSGQIKSALRSRLGHAVADKLVYVHEALHLKHKLQTASYTQHAEKWDSDSDSDESEDEEDLKV